MKIWTKVAVAAVLGLLVTQGTAVGTLNEEKTGMMINNLGGEGTAESSSGSDFCILGPVHPDECSTGSHSYFLYGAHGFFWTVFSGTITSEVDWGPLPGQSHFFSCTGTFVGYDFDGECTESGNPPWPGDPWEHRCWTSADSIGSVGCLVIHD